MKKPSKGRNQSRKSKKTDKRKRRPARRRASPTGVMPEWGFFSGGEFTIAGFKHRHSPRAWPEHIAAEVHEIVTRIEKDIEELVARTLISHSDEQLFRKAIFNEIADRIAPDLMQRLQSNDQTVSAHARQQYEKYVDGILKNDPQEAARGLAWVAKEAALFLENMYRNRPKVMREIAAKFDLWPVNLGLQARRTKGSQAKQALTRTTFARDYLTNLGLNQSCTFPTGHAGGAKPISPITLAAESLQQQLVLLKTSPPRTFMEDTQWSKRLRLLPEPMTRANGGKWWRVAKVFLDERWKKARREFAPLEKHLRLELSSKYPSDSVIKRRVIDDALKKAFCALAQPDL